LNSLNLSDQTTKTQPTGDYESPWTFVAKANLTTLQPQSILTLFCLLSFKKMALFSTNSYNNFQAANSKEYIAFDKGAKQDFCPGTCFDLIPGNSIPFQQRLKNMALSLGTDLCSTFQPIVMSTLLMQISLPTKTKST
jgi:hypothetical protein